MKRHILCCSSGILLLVLTFLGIWQFGVQRLYSPKSVTKETGLTLPDDAKIIKTRAHLFSLADGNNYEWLIVSKTSLRSWASTNMKVETGGWENTKKMSEHRFPEEPATDTDFGEVWKSSRANHQETAYLTLSKDGKVAILETFRP